MEAIVSTGVEHSEVNIRAAGLKTVPSDINKGVVSRNKTKYLPVAINNNNTASATVCNISSQFEFKFTTSNTQWVDLFNTHFLTKYHIAAIENPGHWSHLTQNLIGQAFFYINGVQVAFTNNWTVASTVNKRIQFSKQYNQSINNLVYESDATVAQSIADPAAYAGVGGGYPYPAQAAGDYTDREDLSGFFILDRDSSFVPPNSEIKIIIVADPACYLKSKRHPAAAATTDTCLINSIELVVPSVMKPGVPWAISGGADIAEDAPADYILKFITNSITSSASDNADLNRTLTVDKNICKLAIAFQKAPEEAKDNTIGGENLGYTTQNEKTISTSAITGTAGTNQVDMLQTQLGSIVQPVQAYSFYPNGHREAYHDYLLLTGKTLSYETQESFQDWLCNPIYLFDFPRSISDKSTNMIIRGTRKYAGAAGNCQMHLIEMDEQYVYFQYDAKSGVCISTRTLK